MFFPDIGMSSPVAATRSAHCAIKRRKVAGSDVEESGSGSASGSSIPLRLVSCAKEVIENFSEDLFRNWQRYRSFNHVVDVVSYNTAPLVDGKIAFHLVPTKVMAVRLKSISGQRLRVMCPDSLFAHFPKEDALNMWVKTCLRNLISKDESARPVDLDPGSVFLKDRVKLHRMMGHFSLYMQMRAYRLFIDWRLTPYFGATSHQFGTALAAGSAIGASQAAHHALLPCVFDNSIDVVGPVCCELWDHVRSEAGFAQPSKRVQKLLLLLTLRKIDFETIQKQLHLEKEAFEVWVKTCLNNSQGAEKVSLIPVGSLLYILSNATLIDDYRINEADKMIELVTRKVAMDHLMLAASGDPSRSVEELFSSFCYEYDARLVSLQENLSSLIHELDEVGSLACSLESALRDATSEYITFTRVFVAKCQEVIAKNYFDFGKRPEVISLKKALDNWKEEIQLVIDALKEAAASEVADGSTLALEERIKVLETQEYSSFEGKIKECTRKRQLHVSERAKRLTKLGELDRQYSLARASTSLEGIEVVLDTSSGVPMVLTGWQTVEKQRQCWLKDIQAADKAIALLDEAIAKYEDSSQQKLMAQREIETLKEQLAARKKCLVSQEIKVVLGSLKTLKEAESQVKALAEDCRLFTMHQVEIAAHLGSVLESNVPFPRGSVEFESWIDAYAVSLVASSFDLKFDL